MDPLRETKLLMTRRHFFGRFGAGVGVAALASLLEESGLAQQTGLPGLPHFAPKAKRVIYLYQSGAPSQLDLFDLKPQLEKYRGQNLPDSVRRGQRLTGMTAYQSSFPTAPSVFKFERHGRSGAWLSYGLGSANQNLPAFVVMVSRGTGNTDDQPLYDRLWGSAFLPSKYQGVKFRSGADPVLYLSNPPGVDGPARRRFLDDLAKLNQMRQQETNDPEIGARIAQYEMAFRMQTSVPELTDLSKEPEATFERYGPESRQPGAYAANCLLARRLAERGVRFIQLFHRGWDQHNNLPKQIANQARDTDQPTAALLQDLKDRGMLDDTLVVWGGEFGRTVYSQGKLTPDNYGRDHHPRCFTIWLAGGGVRGGVTIGETDDFSYNIARDPVEVHDLHATMLHCLGVDHTRLTYKFQGRYFRLTDVSGHIVMAALR